MKKIILIIFLVVQQINIGQEISLHKDSLSIISHLPDGFIGSVEFLYFDSLWISNVGQEILKIDSIKTEKTYSYRIKIIYEDTVKYSILHNYEETITLNILPQDSVKVIFADPDFCPICKTNSVEDSFTDKFYIYSNSKNNEIYEVDVNGEAYYTDTKDEILKTNDFWLSQNYPNPFNPNTKISFSLDKYSDVKLIIYDLLGKTVYTLLDKKLFKGYHEINFNASCLSSGTYFYSLISENRILTKKLVILK